MDPSMDFLIKIAPLLAKPTASILKDYYSRENKLEKTLHLKNGSTHALVAEVQKALVATGAKLELDGIYGRNTQLEVLRFQANNGLRTDGICGPVTIAMLLANKNLEDEYKTVAKGGVSPGSVTLQIGSKGVITKAVQAALVDFGYNLDVDGIFGKGTYDAICKFQGYNGIPVDGTCGVKTFAALFKKL